MKINICSDIHLEIAYYEITNPNGAEVLVLAGDIMLSADSGSLSRAGERISRFLADCSDLYQHVIYVPGNHEYYYEDWSTAIPRLQASCARYGNIHVLDDATKAVGDVTFIGATLWTNVNNASPVDVFAVRNGMADYRVITNGRRLLTPEDTMQKHRESVEFLKGACASIPGTKVIVTHHSPTTRSTHEQYLNSPINAGFCSNLDAMVGHSGATVWAYGHVHSRHEHFIGDTYMVCNPRGYVGYEDTIGYLPKTIDLDAIPEQFDRVKWL